MSKKHIFQLFQIVLITVVVLMILFSMMQYSYGSSFDVEDLTGTQQQQTVLRNTGNDIVRVITTIGVIISVIMLIILGIKYMMGSVEEKAEYKKTLLPYTIGAGLVFAASVIAQIVYNLAINL